MKKIILSFALLLMVLGVYAQEQSAYITLNIKKSVPQLLKLYLYKQGDVLLFDSVHFKGRDFESVNIKIPVDRDEQQVKLRFSKRGIALLPILQPGDSLVVNVVFGSDAKSTQCTFSGSERTRELQNETDRTVLLSKEYVALKNLYQDMAIKGYADTLKPLSQMDSVNDLRIETIRQAALNTHSPAILQFEVVGSDVLHFAFSPAEYDLFRQRFKTDSYTLNLIDKYEQKTRTTGGVTGFDKRNGVDLNTYLMGFNLPDAEGKEHELTDYRGKYILVDLWASWCIPCRKESPYLKQALQQFSKKNFRIISISIDENIQAWQQAIKADSTQAFIHLIDNKGWKADVIKRYQVKGIPTNFLLDPTGKVIAEDLRGEEMIKRLGILIDNSPITKSTGK